MNRGIRPTTLSLVATSAVIINGCGGGSSTPPPPPPISVNITSVSSGAVEAGGSVTIIAQIVNDISNKGVTWSVSCSPAPCGMVSPTPTLSGQPTTYTAPLNPPASNVAIMLTATSVADASAFNTVQVEFVSVIVSLSATSGQVPAGGSSVITATVTNDPANKGVNPASWTLTQGAAPCSAGCGALSNQTSSSATYNAPAALPATSVNVTITATAQSDSRQTGNIGIAFEAIQISILPNAATVAEDTSQQLTATVSFDPNNGGVTWALTQGMPRAPCSPACGTLSPANPPSPTGITYNAPGIVPNPAMVTLAATSVTDVRQSNASNITVANPDSALNGQYAFLYSGFDDATGQQVAVVGSFTADGFGNITKGLEDINGPALLQAGVTFTGTYAIGLDNRGEATITNSLGKMITYAFSVGSFSNGVATKGRLIQFDDNTGTAGTRGSGLLRLQDPTAFSQAKITGSYGFGISGQDSKGSRMATVGIFSADGAGNISAKGGLEDINDAGTVSNSISLTGGNYSAPDAVNGHATGSISTASRTTHFSMYVVSANEILLITTDTESVAGLQSGTVLSQVSTPYTNASLNSGSVFYETGVNSAAASPNTQSDVRIGLFTANGTGGLTIVSDENDGGTFTANTSTNGLTYSVDASGNGRVTITGANGSQPILYLVDNNKAFLLGTGASVSSGFLEPQVGVPFSAFSLNGSYSFGNAPPAVTASTVASGTGVAVNSILFPRRNFHTLRLTQDTSASNGTLTLGGTLNSSLSVSPNGRTALSNLAVIYLITPSKFVYIPQSGASPTVSIFER